jgi:hypothetical protein
MPSQVFWRGFPPLPPPAFSGNVGQILINPNFMLTSGDYAFLDLMKMGLMPWGIVGGGGIETISPANVDSNGYPTSLAAGAVSTQIFTPGAGRTGQSAQQYVIRWDGTGTVTCDGTLVSGSLTGTGLNNRAVMDTTGFATVSIGISALPVTNMHFYHIDDETAYLAGQIAGVEFTKRIKQAQAPVFRILNWLGPAFGGTNLCNMTNWASRKPLTYASYCGDELRSSLFAGTTTNSGNDYSITFGSGAPTDKQTIHLYFNAAQSDTSTWNGSGSNLTFSSGSPGTVNWGAALPASIVAGAPVMFGGFAGFSAPPEIVQYSPYYVKTVTGAQTFTISLTKGGTAINFSTSGGSGVVGVRACSLNLNGSGAVPIWDQRLQIMWGPGANLIALNPNQNSGTTSSLGTMVYDAGINVWTLWGGDSSNVAGIGNGVPPEAFIALCAEIGCHPWFESPQLACDPMTDWHTQLATYCKNNAPSWMVPRFEILNEPWNFGNSVSDYAQAKSFVNWGVEDLVNFVGKVASTAGQDISAVYGGTPGTGIAYHLMINSQTGNSNPTDNDMLNSSLYVGQAAAPQSGYIKAPAKNYLTHVAINHYMNSAASITAANTSWNGGANPSAVNAYLDDPTLGFPASAVNNPAGVLGMAAVYTATFSWCQGFTNLAGNKIRMCGYEGGAEVDLGNATNSTIFPFWNACMNTGTNMQLYCTENWQNFIKAGGEHPALFQLSGTPPRSDVWSVLLDVYQSPDPPEWLAVVSFS